MTQSANPFNVSAASFNPSGPPAQNKAGGMGMMVKQNQTGPMMPMPAMPGGPAGQPPMQMPMQTQGSMPYNPQPQFNQPQMGNNPPMMQGSNNFNQGYNNRMPQQRNNFMGNNNMRNMPPNRTNQSFGQPHNNQMYVPKQNQDNGGFKG